MLMNDKTIKTKPIAASTKLKTPRLFLGVNFVPVKMYFNVSKNHGGSEGI